MKIWFTWRMPQRPIGKGTTVVLDYGCQRELQRAVRLKGSEVHSRVELKTIVEVANIDHGRHRDSNWRHPFPIAAEAVCGPLSRGRKIELVVTRHRGVNNERFEAGVFPQAVRAAGSLL